jgi:microcystin-dependent protein
MALTKVYTGALPTGIILPTVSSSIVGTAWLMCDGSAVSRTTYANLFATIGTKYGSGDGSTTFNLPDFRGRVPVGKDNMNNKDANVVTNTWGKTLGGAAGSETHTLATDELPAHGHTYTYKATVGGESGGGDVNNLGNLTVDSNATGGGLSHNNVQPSIILNYIIKT